jgi:hypothetical integral membrane protein (TIGR02206 family)
VPQFSPPHLAALAVWVLGTAVCVVAGRRAAPDSAWVRWFCRALAALILAFWAGEYVADVILGVYTVRFTLPLQLTDLISVTATFALLTRRQWAVELTYFWAFTATLQATLTPDLGQNFPSVYYFTYFGYHIGALLAGAFLVWGLGIRPGRWAAARTLAVTLAWAVVAGTADVITGGNYMYLASKPAHSSLLSVLGPWPWYIAGALGSGAVLLAIVDVVTRIIWRRSEPEGGFRPRGSRRPAAALGGGSASPAPADGSDAQQQGARRRHLEAHPAGPEAAMLPDLAHGEAPPREADPAPGE